MKTNIVSTESQSRPRRNVKPMVRYSATFKSEKQLRIEAEKKLSAEDRTKKAAKTNVLPKLSFSFPGTKRMFRFVRTLGTGTTSWCYEIEDLSTKVKYALKKLNQENKEIACHEVSIYEELYHENIVRCVGVFEDEEFIYLVLQMSENGSLLDLLNKREKFNELETCYFLHQILSGCEYLHSRNLIHHDLKLNNVFLDKDFHVKIGDFGITTKASEYVEGLRGTPNYIAPEMFVEGEPHTNKVDIWSIGIMAFAMLVGFPPFETESIEETYRKIQQNDILFPAYVSSEARNLILALLNTDPSQRPSAAEAKNMTFFNRELPPNLPKYCLARPTNFYEVESIVDKRFNKKGQVEYLIKWKGFSDASNTWMPRSRISNGDLLEEFEQNQGVNYNKERRRTTGGIEQPKKKRAYRTYSN